MDDGMNGFAHFFFKALLQIRTRNAHRIQHLIDLDPFAGVVANVVHRLNDGRVVKER
jgi:uncharacterized protein YkvS